MFGLFLPRYISLMSAYRAPLKLCICVMVEHLLRIRSTAGANISIIIIVITVEIFYRVDFFLNTCPQSSMSCIANLDALSSPLVITAQYRPASTVSLDQAQI